MAKKVTAVFRTELTKNTERGGAWLADFTIATEGVEQVVFQQTAWANAGAGKRWIKAMVQNHTPRKSVKLIDSGKRDEKDKPTSFSGEVSYKVEA